MPWVMVGEVGRVVYSFPQAVSNRAPRAKSARFFIDGKDMIFLFQIAKICVFFKMAK